jgi:ribose-phosphate pyrophosphokinase
MSAALFAFADDRLPAKRLAAALGIDLRPVDLHAFPDGESLPSVDGATQTVLLYRSLDRPDAKLMPLLLACDALRRAGTRRLVLVAPYLPYLRQDAVFQPGQPLSRDVFGALLGPRFERIVTVEPHLHRTSELTPVFGGTPVTTLTVAGLLAARIGAADGPVIVGPDEESSPWVRRIAETLAAPSFVLSKLRRGDQHVELQAPPEACVAGRRVVIVDDICSSGGTLIGAVRLLHAAGAASIEIAVVHALFKPAVGATLRRMGVRSVFSTDACTHPSNRLPLAGLIADALRQELSP